MLVKKVEEESGPLTLRDEPVFWKKDGMLGSPKISPPPYRFYNVEGEAGMRVDNLLSIDINRGNALKERSKRIRQDTRNYQSWLAAFTVFGSNPELVRVVKRKRSRNYVVNKVFICTLLEGRTVDGIDYPRDEWGRHSATKDKYQEASRLSIAERKTNQREVGKIQLVHSSKYPSHWEASMSDKVPTEGYENRARPPTVVQLLAEIITTTPYGLRSVRKPCKAKAFAVKGVVRSPIVRTLSYLIQKEKRILAVKKMRDHLRKKHSLGRKPTTSQRAWLSRFGALMSHPYEMVRYNSWMNAPEAMRLANLTSRYNYVIPSPEQAKIFNEENFFSDYDDYWTNDATDETRLTCWLALRNVHNFKSGLKVPCILSDMSYLERRLIFLDYQFANGKISSEEVYLAARGRLLACNKAHPNFILIGKPYGEPEHRCIRARGVGLPNLSTPTFHTHYGIVIEELYPLPLVDVEPNEYIFASQIGLDTMPPMNDAEYDDITRTEPNTVDDHLLSAGLIGLQDYSVDGLVLAQNIDKAIDRLRADHLSKKLQVRIPVVSLSNLDDDFQQSKLKQKYLSYIIEQVSLRGLKYPNTSSCITGAPASHTVDVDVKKPDKVKQHEVRDNLKARAKVAFDKFLDLIPT